MRLLIRKAVIIDPNSSHHLQKLDLLIEKGIIKAIGANLRHPEAKELIAENAFVSVGWMDMGVQVGDPGFEHREDLRSVGMAAAAGGFTGITCQPNTMPAVHSKSEVLYLINNTRDQLVDFYPMGAISQNCEGKDITEMHDMAAAGAIAFTDGKRSVQDSGLMMRALQYAKAFSGLIINHPHDEEIAGSGQVNEGFISTSLGLKGIPGLAEELMIHRDLQLTAYTDSKLHIANVSTAGGVRLIREAKARGARVTASVPAMNLAFTDEALMSFDSNFKVMPPLRSRKDTKALIKGLKDGTIDLITSNHVPLEEEAKKLEFPFAKFGAIGLETAFPLSRTALGSAFTLEKLVEFFTLGPRRALDLEMPVIEEGRPANLTVFDPDREWTFSAEAIRSKSKNCPVIGMKLKGKILTVLNNHRSALFTIQ